jgi:hypothetical protein
VLVEYRHIQVGEQIRHRPVLEVLNLAGDLQKALFGRSFQLRTDFMPQRVESIFQLLF